VVVDGKRLSRFMDSIYLDRPCEKLDWKKIQILNGVRRPLLERDVIGAVNMRLRSAFARAVNARHPAHVLEWGCGYHPMRGLIDATGYIGVDIDPSVIDYNRGRHPAESWYRADADLVRIADESQDAIVSPFVFHFRLSRHHMMTMRRTLKPAGIVLGNVYRRSPSSRRELVASFKRVGLRVHREKDAAGLCTDHEFWCLVRDDHPDPGTPESVLKEVAAGIAANGAERYPQP
jgi:SAM-dependent methyltransferase